MGGPSSVVGWRTRIRTPWGVAAAVGALLVLAGGHSAVAQDNVEGRRVALVVGSDVYASEASLRNAVNDARAVRAALEAVGFSVKIVENATRRDLTSALGDFAASLRSDDVALFFFAGHGIQIDGTNYLIPTDYMGQTEGELTLDAINAADVAKMLQPARVAMLVLDACRNNPYRGVRGSGSGLARMEARGTLIAYAADAGQVARDAAPGENNGLFTAKLVEQLKVPGLTATQLFRRVRREVVDASNEEQFPALYDNLLNDFVFRPLEPAERPDPLLVSRLQQETTLLQQETTFWQSIVDSNNPANFQDYLSRYPNGAYAGLARNALAELRDPADPPAVDPPSPPPPGTIIRDCSGCPEMVVLPAGRFPMGSAERGSAGSTRERPRHDVQVEAIAIGRYEVTRREYETFVRATGHVPDEGCLVMGDNTRLARSARASWRAPGFAQSDGRHPAVCVSWEDARAYAAWLSDETGARYRLPSEAEWEYAARAGTTTVRYWGDDGADEQCAQANGADRAMRQRFRGSEGVDCADGAVHTAAVGTFTPNAFGLFDMLGNAWEWAADCWHDSYAGAPRDGAAWVEGGNCSLRVLRGGSWSDAPGDVRSAVRRWDFTGLRGNGVGFRVVRVLD